MSEQSTRTPHAEGLNRRASRLHAGVDQTGPAVTDQSKPPPEAKAIDPGIGLTMRPAGARDLDELVRLEQVCFGAEAWSWQIMAGEITGPDRAYWVIESDQGGLVGAAGLSLGKDFAEVMTVEVDPVAQGRGLGRVLMDQLMEKAKQAGLTRVLLEVASNNAAAIGLYQSMGFTAIGRRQGYYQPSGQDALVMQLQLSP